MNLCAAMFNACSVGWRPSVFRPHIVGNRVVQFPYYVRNVDIEQLEHLVYAERDATLAGRPRYLAAYCASHHGAKGVERVPVLLFHMVYIDFVGCNLPRLPCLGR
jgi:hypothetical protein